jgi:DNA-binding transcriptional LysR family regulator
MDRNRSRLSPDRSRFSNFDLNLRSLNIFVQVAESGSISQSARLMGLTQSAVSQTIASLEQCIGVQLFDRDVRPMALTRSGAILLDKARGVLLSVREAIQAARQPAVTALPKLNICLVDTIAGTIGLELVSKIQGFAASGPFKGGCPVTTPDRF